MQYCIYFRHRSCVKTEQFCALAYGFWFRRFEELSPAGRQTGSRLTIKGTKVSQRIQGGLVMGSRVFEFSLLGVIDKKEARNF